MKAAVMTSFKNPLEVQTLPDPVPGPADAVIRTEACGVCRSDWHMWQQDWTWAGIDVELPRVPGHEFGGVVEEVGKDVKNFKGGDRVTVPFHLACGHCVHCQTGHSNRCMAYGAIGFHHHGGYGDYTMVPSADSTLVNLPEEVGALDAAALGCRYMTSYHGIAEQAAVRPGEWVVIFGMGGVGLSSVQIASAIGARVIAVSRNEDKLEQARKEGAIAVLKAGEDVPQQVEEMTKGGADVSIDALGIGETTLAAVQSLGNGGRHVRIGLTGAEEQGNISLPVDLMTIKEISFTGSFGCPTTSYRGLLSLVQRGKLNPTSIVDRTISVEEAGSVLDSMTDYQTRGFNVINQW